MRSLNVKKCAVAIFVACATLMLGVATAAEFPDKPITIVVEWQAGSGPDVAMRILGEIASRDLGQPVVVQNIVGGSGTKGLLAVANAAADGYTILNNWVAPHVVARLFNPGVGYDNDSFEPILGLMTLPFTLAVKADHPANNVAEFVKWANAQGRPINVGVCAALSVPRMVMEEFLREMKITDYNPVPYNGCMPDNVKGLLDGSLDATTGVLIAEKVFKGAIKTLAVFSDERISLKPDIPTAKEQGYDIGWGETAKGWSGLVAPKGLPADVLATLIDTFGKAWRSDEFRQKMAANFMIIEDMDAATFRKLWDESEATLKPAVERLLKAKAKEGS